MGSSCESHYCEQDKPCRYQLDWMRNIPDSMKLSEMTIPGTHESFALHGICIARCQSWSVPEQLKAGIRYLDCRLRMYHDTLRCYHGFIDMKDTLDVIFVYLINFLKEHPTETIIFQVQEEYKKEECTKDMDTLWDEYAKDYLDYIVKYEGHNITMGEIRGKILFINIFKTYATKIPGFTVQNDWTVNCRCYMREKKRKIKRHFNRAITLTDGEKLFLNHLSCSSDYALMTPATGAYKCNKLALRYQGRLGMIMMDYPGEGLIEHLINQNFIPSNKLSPLLAQEESNEILLNNNKLNKPVLCYRKADGRIVEETNLKSNSNQELKTLNDLITAPSQNEQIKEGDCIRLIHLDTRKNLFIESGTGSMYCYKEKMTFNIHHKNPSSDNCFKDKQQVLIRGKSVQREIIIHLMEEEKGDANANLTEGKPIMIETNINGENVYLETSFEKKQNKKYELNYRKSDHPYYPCYFYVEKVK